MPVVRVGERNEIIIPEEVLQKLGAKAGDLVEAHFERVIDVPNSDEQLGPETQASIDAGLADIRAGRVGPKLQTVDELQEYLDKLASRRSPHRVTDSSAV